MYSCNICDEKATYIFYCRNCEDCYYYYCIDCYNNTKRCEGDCGNKVYGDEI